MISSSQVARVLLLLIVSLLCGCMESADSRYDAGYSDGYAVGYNIACDHGTTLVEGDWDDEHYSEGYQDGIVDGETDCREGE